jgi:hypothetical protein
VNKTKSLFIISILLVTTATTGLTTAYAAHGSGSSGGGGCGNCTPPTLGIDKDGIIRVNGGISINTIPFDVELYIQEIPTQVLNKDEKATIVLKIFEDEGVNTVAHAELHIGPHEKVINGILVEHSIAHLVWHNEYGDETIGIYDDDEILQNVKIDAKNMDGLKIISFEFEPTVIMNETSIMTRVWDERKNVVNNYFTDAIKIVDLDNFELTQINKVKPDIPTWIKNGAGWWAEGKISDGSFLRGIEHMIREDIINIPEKDTGKSTDEKNTNIPEWVKQTSKWWSEGLILDSDFVESLQFLIKNKMISI